MGKNETLQPLNIYFRLPRRNVNGNVEIGDTKEAEAALSDVEKGKTVILTVRGKDFSKFSYKGGERKVK